MKIGGMKRIGRIGNSAGILKGARRILASLANLPEIHFGFGAAAYQVRPSAQGWIITERGSSTALRTFTKKADALHEARAMARLHRGHLDVFSRDGVLQNSVYLCD